MLRFRVWQNRDVLPSDVWRVSGGAGIPTGNNWIREAAPNTVVATSAAQSSFRLMHASEEHDNGDSATHSPLVDEHSQIGTGAFSGLLGTDYQHYGDLWSWGASAFGRFPLANERGFRYGISTLTSVTLSYAAAHSLSFAVSPLYRFAARDHSDEGYDPDSGGSVLYLEPAIQWVLKPVSYRAKAAFPVATYLFGDQHEYPVYSVTVAGDFGE